MKLQKKYLTLAMCAAVVCFAVTSVATVSEDSITGTLVHSDSGYFIVNDSGRYLVADYDVSGLLGKTVKVTGSVSEEEGGDKTIHVMSVEESE